MAVKLTVEIDEELRRRAKARAALQGRSLADVVRTALETYVEQTTTSELARLVETDPIFQMAGKYSGSSENVSERVEEILGADSDPIEGLSVSRGVSD
jgi:plasmid stability protein